MNTARISVQIFGTLVLLLFSIASARAQGSSTYALSVSTNADRSAGTALQGATVSGSVYVFTSSAANVQNYSPTGISKVCYWLDNSAMSSTATHCETVSPYDFVRTASNGTALPWDTSTISAGTHTITQSVKLSSGKSEVDTATFSVGSATSTPPPAAPATGSVITLRNTNSNLCVDTGGSTGFATLVQSICSSNVSQQFTLTSSPSTGWFYFASSASNLCWDIAGGSLSAGALVQQYTCTAVSPEYFQLESITGGYQILSSNLANGCVDVVGASTASGANLEQNTCTGSSNQVFAVTIVNGGGTSQPQVSAAPSSASFVNVLTGTSSRQTIVLSNTGTGNLTISQSSVTGSGFSSSGLALPLTLSPGSSTTFNVAFAPTSTGSVNGNLALTSNAPNSPLNIPLSGSAVAATPSVAISTPSNGTSISGTLPVSGTASDSLGISSVAVQVDGGAFSPASGTTNWSYSLNTSSLSNAAHTLTARATDTAGTTASTSITVNVSNSSGGPTVNVKNYGATGNGSSDDTNALNSAINALSSGATLLFPCGTYLTSSQLSINLSNITVDGSSCAVIHNTSSGTVFSVGGSGNGNPNYGSAVSLSSTASELATSFSTVSSLGVAPGDYVLLQQGGQDSSNGSGDTGCDPSGCRGELLKVASVSGNTITVTTAVHDTYNPSLNGATAQKILSPLSAITIKNITFDGNGSNTYGLALAGVAESTISGVTARNVQGSALLNRGDFNVSWSNITVTGAGSAQCGSAVWFENQGNLQINGMTISNENPGAPMSGCLYNGAFGFELIASANSTITNLSVDASGAYGRPFKTTAARYNTFNSPTVQNGVQDYNGISLEYYSSHNTYNNCVVTNNGAGTGTGTGNAGIITFGNFNQYNSFNNCTVSGNGNVQFYISGYDALRLAADSHNTISGGSFTGSNTTEAAILIEGDSTYITGATISGPGAQGIYLDTQATNACVNNNTFLGGSSLGSAISANGSNDMGLGNLLNLLSSDLSAGSCSAPLP